jgi:hypothetical protein
MIMLKKKIDYRRPQGYRIAKLKCLRLKGGRKVYAGHANLRNPLIDSIKFDIGYIKPNHVQVWSVLEGCSNYGALFFVEYFLCHTCGGILSFDKFGICADCEEELEEDDEFEEDFDLK